MPTPHPNRPSKEELTQMVKYHPEYRSSVTLGRHLGVSDSAARRYLCDAGITPYSLSESLFVAHYNLTEVRMLSDQELRQLVIEHPEYKNITTLSRYLRVKDGTAEGRLLKVGIEPVRRADIIKVLLSPDYLRNLINEHPQFRSVGKLVRYLKDNNEHLRNLKISPNIVLQCMMFADIQPANKQEAAFIKFGKVDVNLPTADELRQLIQCHPEYSIPSELAKYLNISAPTAKRWLVDVGAKPNFKSPLRVNFEDKVKYVTDYLFSANTLAMLRKEGGVSLIHLYIRDRSILSQIAVKTGKTIEELEEIRDKKLKLSRNGTQLEIRAKAVVEYLSSGNFTKIGKRYHRSGSSIKNWTTSREILGQVAAQMGITLGEVMNLIKYREKQIKDAPTFQEFLESDEKARVIVEVLQGHPAALGEVLALKYPHLITAEDVPEYLPSLGPYLGRFRKRTPTGWGGIGPVIGDITLDDLIKNRLLRETFKNLGRNYYFSFIKTDHPTDIDKQTFLSLIAEDAENEQNPTLKWLKQQLFDEIGMFHNLSSRLARLKQNGNGK